MGGGFSIAGGVFRRFAKLFYTLINTAGRYPTTRISKTVRFDERCKHIANINDLPEESCC